MLFNITAAAAPDVTVVARPKAMVIKWPVISDDLWESSVVVRYLTLTDANADTNRNLEIPTFENKVRDDDELTVGATYYYRVYWIDIWGNPSALSAEQHATYKPVQAADTDATALAAPAGLALALNYQDIDGDGSIDTTYKATWTALTGAVRYELEVSRSDTSGGAYTVIDNMMTTALLASFKVITGKFYKARIRAFNAFGTPGAWSALTAASQPSGKTTGPSDPTSFYANAAVLGVNVSWDNPPEDDYSYTEIAGRLAAGTPTDDQVFATLSDRLATVNFVYYPLNNGVATNIWARHVNTSGVKSNWVLTGSAYSGMGVFKEHITDNAVTTPKIDFNAVSVWEVVDPAGNVTVPASTTADVITGTSNHTTDGTDVEISGQFKNNSGGFRTVDIIIRAGGTDIKTFVGVTIVDQEWWSGSYIYSSISGASTVFSIRVMAGGSSVTLNNRTMSMKARKGK